MFFNYTIVNTPRLLQTEPEGKPALDVGTFIIDKLFTNVAQLLFAEIQEPTINEEA